MGCSGTGNSRLNGSLFKGNLHRAVGVPHQKLTGRGVEVRCKGCMSALRGNRALAEKEIIRAKSAEGDAGRGPVEMHRSL